MSKPKKHSPAAEQREASEASKEETVLWSFQVGDKLGSGQQVSIRPRFPSIQSSSSDDYSQYTFTEEEKSWRKESACKDEDPDIFFPERGQSVLPAYMICVKCPVRFQCLETSLREKFGVWAGFTAEERSKIRRRVNQGGSLVEAADRWDAKRYRKLVHAEQRNSPALYYRGREMGEEFRQDNDEDSDDAWDNLLEILRDRAQIKEATG